MDIIAIYNIALGKVGTRTTVSATTEGSNEANSCNVYYESVRDAMLRGAPWNFARSQILLTQLKSAQDPANSPPAPWGYEYAYPNDCIRARFILPQIPPSLGLDGVPLDSSGAQVLPQLIMGPPVKFSLGVDADASGNDIRVILTNQYQAQLVYTKKIVDPNLYDPEYIEALGTALAAAVCRNVTGDRVLAADLRQEALNLLNEARATNGSEGLEVLNPTPDWMRVRGYNSDYQPLGYNDWDSLFQIV